MLSLEKGGILINQIKGMDWWVSEIMDAMSGNFYSGFTLKTTALYDLGLHVSCLAHCD